MSNNNIINFNNLSAWILPVLLSLCAVIAIGKRADIYQALRTGAQDGLKTLLYIFPGLIALLPAVAMFRASGALDWLVNIFTPVLKFFDIPSELAPLMLIRPISGSGAVGVAGEIIRDFGPDSVQGRTAAVMLGSTETTFYTIAVYFGAANIRRTRHAIPAALIADLTGFIAAALTVRLFF